MKASADAWASATWAGSSEPTTRNFACFHAAAAISRDVKKRRR
jgi:hypothetical protein